MKTQLWPFSAVVATIVLAGCGGGGDGADTATANPLQVVADDGRAQILSGTGGGGGGGGAVGGGGAPATCVAEISAFNNTAGYGPYGGGVADIKTRFTVKNCTAQAVNWQAKLIYRGPFWGGTVFDFPLTCAMPIAANSSATCQVTERYLLILQTYDVSLQVLDAAGNVLATTSAAVATPLVPNPAAT